MNTRQEIEDAFDGQDRGELPPPAVFTQTGTVGQMEACGAFWPEACRSVRVSALPVIRLDSLSIFARAEAIASHFSEWAGSSVLSQARADPNRRENTSQSARLICFIR